MLELTTEKRSLFNEESNEFVEFPGGERLMFEHSLYSISKWESKWEIPFLRKEEKTNEQTIDYVRCMVVSGEIPEPLELALTPEQLTAISNYINAKMTATVVALMDSRKNSEVVTSELVYYWMVALNIPMECEHWHFNRLMMLIQVANAKNNPKKMGRQEALQKQRELNELRRAKYGTSG